jgi:hypothetical protein
VTIDNPSFMLHWQVLVYSGFEVAEGFSVLEFDPWVAFA